MLLLDTIFGPFAFVDGEAVEESGGFVGFEFAVVFQERGGDEKFIVGEPLGGISEAGGVFEDGDAPLLAVERGAPIGRAIEDGEVFGFGFEVGDQARGIAGFEGDAFAAGGESALDVEVIQIG